MLYAEACAPDLPQRLPAVLLRFLPAENALCHFFPGPRARGTVTDSADFAARRALFARFNEVAHEHPALRRRSAPGSISDFLTRRAWERTALCREVFHELGAADDLGVDVGLRRGAHLSAVVLRKEWAWSADDRVLLLLAAPHLRQAWNQWAAGAGRISAGATSADLEEALGRGLVPLDREGYCLEITDRTRAQLAHFSGQPCRGRCLPEPIRAWVREQLARFQGGNFVERPPVTYRLAAGCATLLLRLVARPAENRYWLLTESVPALEAQLMKLGLSQREGEVLRLVADGLANKEIARALCLSLHTVKRHLERIYDRLHVHSRHAATARFRSAFTDRRDPPAI